ncbi:MAG: SLBB domain-containing protein [Spirochaetes bacterium]|nr:SLBB domain-containing protein [Spirochaetota bacterium]
MKRSLASLALLACLAALAAAEAPATGFGINGPTGPVYTGGDPAEITRRILAATRYRLTPGDTYQLMFQVDQTYTYPLVLQDTYDLDLPVIGTINVKGMEFAALRKLVIDRIRKAYPLSVYVTFNLLVPARFDVAVFGGVESPGVVTVTPLSMVSDAIALAKGIRKGGSYRRVLLTRGGKDLEVDLLAYNNSEPGGPNNPYLQPGDRITIPAAGVVVTLSGQVRFPGQYEMLPEETLAHLLAYAGGLLPEARADAVELVRFKAGDRQSQSTLDARTQAGTVLANGDRIQVGVPAQREMVLVQGGLFGAPVSADKPVVVPVQPISVDVPWTPGLSVLQVLETLGGPTPYAKGKNAVLVRKTTGERIPVDVDALWSGRDPAGDLPLEPGDTLSVPIVNEVFVAGEVHVPGKVVYSPAFTVAEYLVAAGGIDKETGSLDSLWFVDAEGNRTRVTTSSVVPPGTVIYVDRNTWTKTQKTFTNIMVVTGFMTAIVAFVTAVAELWVTYLAP